MVFEQFQNGDGTDSSQSAYSVGVLLTKYVVISYKKNQLPSKFCTCSIMLTVT